MLHIPNQEDCHDYSHKERIEHIEKHLVGDEITAVALEVLDDSKDAADQNNGAGGVQNVQVSPPRDGRTDTGLTIRVAEAVVEQHRSDNKESKDTYLHKEAADDDLLPYLEKIQRSSRLYASASSLECKCKDVSSDKDARHPVDRDQG